MQSALIDLYKRQPVTIAKANGATLYDTQGKSYLDLSSGLGVNILGHNHPVFVESLKQQLDYPLHLSNGFNIPQQESLAERLCDLTGLDQAFICNCGAEANETAFKIARLYANSQGITHPKVIVMEGAFHGRTLNTLSASSAKKVQAGFEPLVDGYIRVKFNDIEAIQQIAQQRQDVVGVCLEPIQGYGGIHAATKSYLQKLRDLCIQQQWLLIADEIQCGHGRTGQYLSLQHVGIKPDVVSLAKGLGGGIPIGACLTTHALAKLFSQGSHGSTFGGNPFACHAALTTLDILNNENLIEKAGLNGDLFLSTLTEVLGANQHVKDIRGKGSMIGIELDIEAMPIRQAALEKGLLIDVTAHSVIRLLPPYILEADQINHACHLINQLIPK